MTIVVAVEGSQVAHISVAGRRRTVWPPLLGRDSIQPIFMHRTRVVARDLPHWLVADKCDEDVDAHLAFCLPSFLLISTFGAEFVADDLVEIELQRFRNLVVRSGDSASNSVNHGRAGRLFDRDLNPL